MSIYNESNKFEGIRRYDEAGNPICWIKDLKRKIHERKGVSFRWNIWLKRIYQCIINIEIKEELELHQISVNNSKKDKSNYKKESVKIYENSIQ